MKTSFRQYVTSDNVFNEFGLMGGQTNPQPMNNDPKIQQALANAKQILSKNPNVLSQNPMDRNKLTAAKKALGDAQLTKDRQDLTNLVKSFEVQPQNKPF